MQKKFKTVDEYIIDAPQGVRIKLNKIRALVLENAPASDECISYNMPAYKTFGKPLIYFAAFKHHIGLYATPSGHTAFRKELERYKSSKGSVQFPLDEDLPEELIKKIIQFRVAENNELHGPK